MNSILYNAVIATTMLLAGCDNVAPIQTTRILEVKCKVNSGLDHNRRCLQIDKMGAEIDIKVNVNVQKVQLYIVRNDGNWWIKDLILDKCDIVDASNWKCIEDSQNSNSAFGFTTEYGMLKGRFYHTITGNGPPEYYTSSISDLAYWALHFGVVDFATAVDFGR